MFGGYQPPGYSGKGFGEHKFDSSLHLPIALISPSDAHSFATPLDASDERMVDTVHRSGSFTTTLPAEGRDYAATVGQDNFFGRLALGVQSTIGGKKRREAGARWYFDRAVEQGTFKLQLDVDAHWTFGLSPKLHHEMDNYIVVKYDWTQSYSAVAYLLLDKPFSKMTQNVIGMTDELEQIHGIYHGLLYGQTEQTETCTFDNRTWTVNIERLPFGDASEKDPKKRKEFHPDDPRYRPFFGRVILRYSGPERDPGPPTYEQSVPSEKSMRESSKGGSVATTSSFSIQEGRLKFWKGKGKEVKKEKE